MVNSCKSCVAYFVKVGRFEISCEIPLTSETRKPAQQKCKLSMIAASQSESPAYAAQNLVHDINVPWDCALLPLPRINYVSLFFMMF